MRRFVAVLLPLLFLTGCAGTPEGTYLSTVRDNAPSIAAATDAELIALGKQVCGLFDEHGAEKAFPEIESEWEGTGVDAEKFADAAVRAYCPEYDGDF